MSAIIIITVITMRWGLEWGRLWAAGSGREFVGRSGDLDIWGWALLEPD